MWRLVHQWSFLLFWLSFDCFWLFLTVFEEWYTVLIVKNTQKHWCTNDVIISLPDKNIVAAHPLRIISGTAYAWKQTSCGPSGLIWNYRGISFLYNFTNYERMAGNKYIIEHVKTKFTTQIFIYKLQSNTRWHIVQYPIARWHCQFPGLCRKYQTTLPQCMSSFPVARILCFRLCADEVLRNN